MSASIKRLGQHFLKDISVLRAIAEAVEPRPGETVIEIGPGHGELTKELALRCEFLGVSKRRCRIVAIEKDVLLAQQLREKFADNPEIKFVEGDALRLLPEITKSYQLSTKNYAVVGNIPYYITGRFLRILGELEERPSRIVLTIQKEVAERIVAEPPRMNRLAAIVQFWAEPRILRIVPRSAFRPEPDVDSAIIVLSTKQTTPKTIGFPAYVETARRLFAQPRKTVLNNLRASAPASDVVRALQAVGVAPDLRPQDLAVQTITDIATRLAKT